MNEYIFMISVISELLNGGIEEHFEFVLFNNKSASSKQIV